MKKFTDAVGQKCDGTGLFLDLDVELEEDCFYELGESTPGEPPDFYIAFGPCDTDGHRTNDEVRTLLSHSVHLKKFLKYAFGKEANNYYDCVFAKTNVDITVVYAKLMKWLKEKRTLLKTKCEGYKWLLENVK